ncbi:hypothetical protein SVA_1172 [Sulfurifustis variabilis]|uniref:DUF5329 domain-containing protein n=1 Tax=Sulfurifustis variabilis TaxID=1675686 RepID=A0A1B4VDD0_9GAMM|nr:DUF5329 family protein [Sulfurifustis variabilis]BAU47747.1 hypothetical protein SVA_1172 [Sulfurifustis variabilis]
MTRRPLLAVLLFAWGVAPADVPPGQRAEVEHLLAFVTRSECLFIRNDAAHTGAKAAAHMRKKYEYFRDRIRSTEDFIELAASRSTTSGKPYTVRCGAQPGVATRDWLEAELGRHRRTRRAAP